MMDTNIKIKKEIPISLFSFLFSEIIQYVSKSSENNNYNTNNNNNFSNNFDFEEQLSSFGYPIGEKMLEITTLREKGHKRELKIVNILQFVHNNLWKHLFNKQADGIQRSTDDQYEYRLIENTPIVNKYISQKTNSSNIVSFIAGIIEGFLNSAGFKCKVTAYFLDTNESGSFGKTFYIIKFDKDLVDKDDKMP